MISTRLVLSLTAREDSADVGRRFRPLEVVGVLLAQPVHAIDLGHQDGWYM